MSLLFRFPRSAVLTLLLPLWVMAQPAHGKDFSLNGRISVRLEETTYYGNVIWTHDDAHDQLIITGPLGQGFAELQRTPQGASLRMADGRSLQAESLEVLSAQLFGTPLPLAQLADWVCGIAPQANMGDNTRPRYLIQDDWQIEWLRYDQNTMPQLISVSNEKVALRLRIDEHNTDSPAPLSVPTP